MATRTILGCSFGPLTSLVNNHRRCAGIISMLILFVVKHSITTAIMSSRSISKVFELVRPLRNHDPALFFQNCRASSSKSTSTLQSCRQHPAPVISPQQFQARAFSSTPRPQATIVKQNPRTDEDGNELSITISERAAKRLKKIVSAPPKKNTLTSAPAQASPDSHLRVTVTAGGCHGFQYLMSLEPADKIDPEEDTIFEFEDSDEGAKAEVVMDQPSLELLKGSTVDFTTELIGSQFKIVGNPRATSSCGCGTSFDIE